MTLDEYLDEISARRNELLLRLWICKESAIPTNIKNERLVAIGDEARALRLEIEAAVREYLKRPS